MFKPNSKPAGSLNAVYSVHVILIYYAFMYAVTGTNTTLACLICASIFIFVVYIYMCVCVCVFVIALMCVGEYVCMHSQKISLSVAFFELMLSFFVTLLVKYFHSWLKRNNWSQFVVVYVYF